LREEPENTLKMIDVIARYAPQSAQIGMSTP